MGTTANPFKPLSQMEPGDWQKLGFKSGLEIHQQLLTKRKLFCRCPAGIYNNESYDAEILRHMRPTLSELGEYDPTALMEFKTRKEIVYQLINETVCTYEMDDAPPFEMDDEALDIAIETAMLLRLNLVSELHIARKQYLDGSIPTGFQRTTILGNDGTIPLNGRDIGIEQLGLEEDSCRIISDIGHTVTFRTDRLGMPLIEVVTKPELFTPTELMEAGEVIRSLVRSTGKVRIGHGSARQDVNVSIEGGTRIEIKGVPSLKAIPQLAYYEAMRQWNLLRIRSLLHERGITSDAFRGSWRDVTAVVSRTDYVPIKQALESGMRVGAVLLEGFEGILGEKVMPGINFAREISERVRVIACLMGKPNIVHSDSMEQEISNTMGQKIRRALSARKGDAIILVWGSEQDVETAAKEIMIRAKEATEGIPSETRQGRPDGTNGFERILPGADRMYPDTDLPPKPIADERIERIRAQLPEFPWDREVRYKELGVPTDVIKTFMRYPDLAKLYAQTMATVDNRWGRFVSVIIGQRFRSMKRRGIDMKIFGVESITAIISALEAGTFNRESLFYLLWDLVLHQEFTVENVFAKYSINNNDAKLLEEAVTDVCMHPPHFFSKDPQVRNRFITGTLMKRFQGRLTWDQVSSIVDQKLSEVCNGGL